MKLFGWLDGVSNISDLSLPTWIVSNEKVANRKGVCRRRCELGDADQHRAHALTFDNKTRILLSNGKALTSDTQEHD